LGTRKRKGKLREGREDELKGLCCKRGWGNCPLKKEHLGLKGHNLVKGRARLFGAAIARGRGRGGTGYKRERSENARRRGGGEGKERRMLAGGREWRAEYGLGKGDGGGGGGVVSGG